MRAIDADALQLAIVEEGQENKRKKYNFGDIWELTGAEIREVINSLPTIQPEIVRCNDCKYAEYIDDVQTLWCAECGQGRTVAPNDFCSYAERREGTT